MIARDNANAHAPQQHTMRIRAMKGVCLGTSQSKIFF